VERGGSRRRDKGAPKDGREPIQERSKKSDGEAEGKGRRQRWQGEAEPKPEPKANKAETESGKTEAAERDVTKTLAIALRFDSLTSSIAKRYRDACLTRTRSFLGNRRAVREDEVGDDDAEDALANRPIVSRPVALVACLSAFLAAGGPGRRVAARWGSQQRGISSAIQAPANALHSEGRAFCASTSVLSEW
jgi:hypothetical protein